MLQLLYLTLFFALPVKVYSQVYPACALQKIDLVFVLDESNDVDATGYGQMLDFVEAVVQNITLDNVTNFAVALVEYSGNVNSFIDLATYPTEADKAALIADIQARTNAGGSRNTRRGLRSARRDILAPGKDRTDAPNVVVLLTHGVSQNLDGTQTQAVRLRRIAEVFAIGIGPNVDLPELDGIVSDPNTTHLILSEFASLASEVENLINLFCEPCFPACNNSGVCNSNNNTCTCTNSSGDRCECELCDVNAVCADRVCTCAFGYTGTGLPGGCDLIYPCESNPCGANAFCIDQIGSFQCQCDPGFTGNANTGCVACVCDVNATCKPNDCVCDDGFDGDGLPGTCQDFNECVDQCDDCHPNATCTNTIGSFFCTCNVGFTGDGVNCTNLCDFCNVNATCINFECFCNDGYVGDGTTFCDDIDECEEGCDNCDGNATCTNTPGSFTCTCNPGYQGNGVNCTDTNECETVARVCATNATCTNTVGSFMCECDTGYVGDGVTFCDDVDECEEGCDDCSGNALCTNTDGSYTCTCLDGFTGNGVTCTALVAD